MGATLLFDGHLSWGTGSAAVLPNSSVVVRTDVSNTYLSSSNNFFGGAIYVDGLFQAQSISPNLQMFKTNGAVNQKYTRWFSDAAECDLQLLDDGYSVATNLIRTTRSQHVISTIERGDNLSTWNVVSDMNAKTNVRPLVGASQRALMRSLQIYTYDYTGDFGIKVGPGIGPLAQEAQLIFPNSVQTIMRSRDSSNPDPTLWSAPEPLLVFNPDTLYMAHVAYTQALDDDIEALKARVTALEGTR
jgi:hypothetical protein